MKYQHEIEINRPLKEVIDLFDNPDNMKHWQPGFISFETFAGESGQPGAQSRIKYKMGKRDIEMIETIEVRNLPDEFSGTYETKGVYNWINNSFVEMGPDKTKWISRNEFKFSGFMKIMAFFMPGAFKKQSYKYMELFKAFAEGETVS